MFYLNKPLSPHLTIYNIQSSSLISILHRITSIFLVILCIYVLFIQELCLNLFYYNFLFLYKLEYNLLHFLLHFLFISSFFHFINGLKIIILNYNLFTSYKFIDFIFLFYFCLILKIKL